MEFSDIITGVPKDKFRASANKLLNECFIIKQDKATVSDYNLILNQREVFSGYFELLGYEIVINEESGVITLNNILGTGRIHLRKIESILLLILRLLYVEKKKQLSERNEVIIVADEIYDKYAMLKFKNRLDKATLKNALGMFKRYHLLSNLDKDMSDPDTRIMIWPSIMFAVTMSSINDIYESAKEKLDKYAAGGEKDDVSDNTDNEEADED